MTEIVQDRAIVTTDNS